jgi:hypothetical protein
MKNLILTAAALLVLAGSTFQMVTVNNSQISATAKPKTLTTGPAAQTIPPPTCPPNDPNGCGIFD